MTDYSLMHCKNVSCHSAQRRLLNTVGRILNKIRTKIITNGQIKIIIRMIIPTLNMKRICMVFIRKLSIG